MDFSKLNQLKIEDLFKSLTAGGSVIKGPVVKYLVAGGLALIVFIIYFVYFFLPGRAESNQIEGKVNSIPEMQQKSQLLDVSIKKAQQDLSESEASYSDLNRLFSVESEMEELYRKISLMARQQGLIITSLSKDGEESIYQANTNLPLTNQAAPNPNAPKPSGDPLFYRIKLKVEMSGTYGRYLSFRRTLANFEKSVNVDKEVISLVAGNARGAVAVKAQLSIFRLPQKLQTKLTQGDAQILRDTLSEYLGGASTSLVSNPYLIKVAADAAEPPTTPPEGKQKSEPVKSTTAATAPTSKAKKNKTSGSADEEELVDFPKDASKSAAPMSRERDPFSRSTSGMIEGGRDPRVSPLLMAPPEAYVITGIIVSESVKAAVIRTDFKESYVVKVGDKLGNQGGKVSRIDAESLTVQQKGGSVKLYLQSPSGQSMGVDMGGSMSSGAR
jgi:Tfp pilus assembly protein PilO